MAPTKDRAGAARCEPFSTWALPTVLQGKKKHPRRAGEGIKRCRSTRVYKERIDPRLEFPRSRDFESRYRLPPKMVKFLTDEFQASPFCPTKMEYGDKGRPIPLFNKVCYALRFLATGGSYKIIRDTQGGCSDSSITRAVQSFVKFLVWKSESVISFPKRDELHEAAVRFSRRYGMDQCVGCLDGTYVPISRPVNNEGAYVTRHGYHALNVLVVTDSEQKFTFVESGIAGSNHDTYVLENSEFAKVLYNSDRLGNYFLLGDSGYGLSPQLFTPLRFQNTDDMAQHEALYQKDHTSARSSVERALGQLKLRWRCLSKHSVGTLDMTPLWASWVVIACCTLHNLCVDWGLRRIQPGENTDPELEKDILKEAKRRLERSLAQTSLVQQGSSALVRENRNTDNYRTGFLKRAKYIHYNYGGPKPGRRPWLQN